MVDFYLVQVKSFYMESCTLPELNKLRWFWGCSFTMLDVISLNSEMKTLWLSYKTVLVKYNDHCNWIKKKNPFEFKFHCIFLTSYSNKNCDKIIKIDPLVFWECLPVYKPICQGYWAMYVICETEWTFQVFELFYNSFFIFLSVSGGQWDVQTIPNLWLIHFISAEWKRHQNVDMKKH